VGISSHAGNHPNFTDMDGKRNTEGFLKNVDKKDGGTTMSPRMKLIAGSGKISFRLLTDEETKELGLEDLKPTFCYGLITSLGWNFIHTKEGDLIVFDMNNAIKVNKDAYVIDEKMVLCKYVEMEPAEGGFFKGLRN
jgi:hypothetical protein